MACIHFSVLGEKGVCGVSPKGGAFSFTADVVTLIADDGCSRCKQLVQDQNATGADVWALEAAAERDRKLKDRDPEMPIVPTKQHVQQLYALAVKKRYVEVKKAQDHLEYEQDQLHQTTMRAMEFGVVVGPVSGTVHLKEKF